MIGGMYGREGCGGPARSAHGPGGDAPVDRARRLPIGTGRSSGGDEGDKRSDSRDWRAGSGRPAAGGVASASWAGEGLEQGVE